MKSRYSRRWILWNSGFGAFGAVGPFGAFGAFGAFGDFGAFGETTARFGLLRPTTAGFEARHSQNCIAPKIMILNNAYSTVCSIRGNYSLCNHF